MTDDLSKIVLARSPAKRAYRTIQENLFFGVGVVHVLGLTAALLGWIGPIQAAMIHLAPIFRFSEFSQRYSVSQSLDFMQDLIFETAGRFTAQGAKNLNRSRLRPCDALPRITDQVGGEKAPCAPFHRGYASHSE